MGCRNRMGQWKCIFGGWPVQMSLGLMTACCAVWCKSLWDLLVFVFVDIGMFAMQMFLLVEAGGHIWFVRLGRARIRRNLVQPPIAGGGTEEERIGFLFYDMCVSSTSTSVGFLTLVLLFPLSTQLPYDTIHMFFFPRGLESFLFLSIMCVIDFLQDIVAQRICLAETGSYPLGQLFLARNRIVFFSSWAASIPGTAFIIIAIAWRPVAYMAIDPDRCNELVLACRHGTISDQCCQ